MNDYTRKQIEAGIASARRLIHDNADEALVRYLYLRYKDTPYGRISIMERAEMEYYPLYF